MADLWKTVDRGPATPLPTPGALLNLDAVPATVDADFPPLVGEGNVSDEDDVPFIEVGGPRPVMKHLEPMPDSQFGVRNSEFQKLTAATTPTLPDPVRNSALRTPHAAPDPVMTVRFDSVHADQRPAAAFGPEIVAYHQPDHAVSIQYRSLIAEISAQLPGSKPRAILIVATRDAVGASTVILNLGVTLARHNEQRVTLLDANSDQPALAAKLGISASPGLRDVIARGNPPAWSVQETAQRRLFALAAERSDAAAIGALASVIEQLRSRNDWVVVDAGCWHHRLLPVAEACDAIYLVHGDADPAARDMVAAILNATGRLRGCIITKR